MFRRHPLFKIDWFFISLPLRTLVVLRISTWFIMTSLGKLNEFTYDTILPKLHFSYSISGVVIKQNKIFITKAKECTHVNTVCFEDHLLD